MRHPSTIAQTGDVDQDGQVLDSWLATALHERLCRVIAAPSVEMVKQQAHAVERMLGPALRRQSGSR